MSDQTHLVKKLDPYSGLNHNYQPKFVGPLGRTILP